MSMLAFVQWCEASLVGGTIRRSLWLFPVIESFHLVAFAVLGGTVLLVDLRLLGLVMRSQPVALLAAGIRPFFRGSLAVMLVSGVLLFLSESLKCYYSFPFKVKIASLLIAIVFAGTIRRKAASADDALGPFWSKLVAVISIALWATVAWGGRWTGFSG